MMFDIIVLCYPLSSYSGFHHICAHMRLGHFHLLPDTFECTNVFSYWSVKCDLCSFSFPFKKDGHLLVFL